MHFTTQTVAVKSNYNAPTHCYTVVSRLSCPSSSSSSYYNYIHNARVLYDNDWYLRIISMQRCRVVVVVVTISYLLCNNNNDNNNYYCRALHYSNERGPQQSKTFPTMLGPRDGPISQRADLKPRRFVTATTMGLASQQYVFDIIRFVIIIIYPV